jgi:hypothetical protein
MLPEKQESSAAWLEIVRQKVQSLRFGVEKDDRES